MKKFWLAMLTLIACGPAAAQIEAGEWEFTSVSTSRLFPGPQNATFRRCIPKEEAANPDRWMANPGPQSDCKITPGAKTANTYSWQMECPGAKMRGNGTARMTASTMDGETVMNGEVQGQKFELRTKVTGKRLGPCKG
jgi:Protein of unknown function (DUF3617)